MMFRLGLRELSAYTILLAPLVISNSFLFAFTLPRWAWLLASICLFAITGLLCVKEKWVVQLRQIDVAFFLLIAVTFTSLLVADDVSAGLWSTAARTTGVVLYGVIFVWYVLMRFTSWSSAQWMRMITVVCAVAIISSVWGVVSYLMQSDDRLTGTAGNALIMGNYLAPIFFLAIFLWVTLPSQFHTRKYQWFAGVSVVVILTGVFLTLTRSALLGIIIGTVFCLVFFFSSYRGGAGKKIIQRIAIIGTLFAVVYAGIFTYLQFQKTPDAARLLAHISVRAISSQSLTTRMLNWGIAWSAIKERPIFGWGWENYRVAVDKYFNPEISEHSFYETRIDKPHNVILEVWATLGTVGLLLYVGLAAVIVVTIRRLIVSGTMTRPEGLVIGGFFIAHYVQNFFSFDTPQSLLNYSFILAYLASRDTKEVSVITVSSRSIRVGIIIVISCAMAVLLVYGGWGALRSAYYSKQGLDAAKINNFDAIDSAHRSAFQGIRGPYVFETWRWFSQALLFNYASGKQKIDQLSPEQLRRWHEDVNDISVLLDYYMVRYPRSVEWQTFGGKIAYHIALAKNDATYLDRSKSLFLNVRDLAPLRQEPPVLLSYIAGLQGDHAAAIRWYEQAAKLAGTQENKLALDFLLDVFVKAQDKASAVSILEIAVQHQPDANTYARLAAAYAQVKRFDNARAAVQKAIEYDPEFAAEGHQFILTFPTK